MPNYILTAADPDRYVNASNGNDTITASTTGHPGDQVHIRALEGDDVINMNLATTLSMSNIMHGFHAFGGLGADEFRFTGIAGITGTVVGRIDDFDLSQDKIYVGGQLLDLSNPGTITGCDVSIISLVQPNNFGITEPQQWLRISTANGQALIALEGARLQIGSDEEENHFIDSAATLPTMFTSIGYEDALNFIPASHIPSPVTGYIDHGRDSNGDDVFSGSTADDLYSGNRGHDSIVGGAGNDTLYGEFGNDSLWGGAGNDILDGGKGRDIVYGGDGNDVIAGGTDEDTLHGGNGADRIYGGTENDLIYGNAGNDTIEAGSGNDQVYGGNNDDIIYGRRGNDRLSGESGNDTLYGNAGNDTLIGGEGKDYLAGGVGADTFQFTAVSHSGVGATNRDVVSDFTRGTDRIHFSAIDSNSVISGDQAFTFSGNIASVNSVWWVTNGTSSIIIRGDVNGDSSADFEIELSGVTSLSESDFIL